MRLHILYAMPCSYRSFINRICQCQLLFTIQADPLSRGFAVETTEYMPYGGTRKHTGTEVSNYKFTDQELDPESGLYNYDARMYDPMIGRFISADTIVPRPFDPQSLNRYSYARNNPLIYVDPSGHEDGDLDDTGGGWGIDGEADDIGDAGYTGGDTDEGFGGPGPDNPTSDKPPTVIVNPVALISGFVLKGLVDLGKLGLNVLADILHVVHIAIDLEHMRSMFVEEMKSKLKQDIREITIKEKAIRDYNFNIYCDPLDNVSLRQDCYRDFQDRYQERRDDMISPHMDRLNALH